MQVAIILYVGWDVIRLKFPHLVVAEMPRQTSRHLHRDC